MSPTPSIAEIDAMLVTLKGMAKKAFQPGTAAGQPPPMDPAMAAQMQGGAPPDPAMMQGGGGGQPPAQVDPNLMMPPPPPGAMGPGQLPPGVDPSMLGGAMPPGGGVPPAMPPEMEQITSQLMAGMDELTSLVERLVQENSQLKTDNMTIKEQLIRLETQFEFLEKSIQSPAAYQEPMGDPQMGGGGQMGGMM